MTGGWLFNLCTAWLSKIQPCVRLGLGSRYALARAASFLGCMHGNSRSYPRCGTVGGPINHQNSLMTATKSQCAEQFGLEAVADVVTLRLARRPRRGSRPGEARTSRNSPASPKRQYAIMCSKLQHHAFSLDLYTRALAAFDQRFPVLTFFFSC